MPVCLVPAAGSHRPATHPTPMGMEGGGAVLPPMRRLRTDLHSPSSGAVQWGGAQW